MRLVWLAVALACGCGPSSYDDFRTQLVKVACDYQVRCGIVGASERRHCDPTVIPSVVPASAEEPDVAVKNGRMRYFSDRAQDCLDAIAGARCDPLSLSQRIALHCHNVIAPGAGPGQTCFGDGECEGGTCMQMGSTACPGVCVAYPPLGTPCTAVPLTCDPTVEYCGPGDSDAGSGNVCLLRKQQGDACTQDAECAYGWQCVDGTCGPLPLAGADDACGGLAPDCEEGLYCDATGHCVAQGKNGAPCFLEPACQSGLTCLGGNEVTAGTCEPWLDAGQTCTPGAMGCPLSQLCDSASSTCVMQAPNYPVTYGEACTQDADCYDDLYCLLGVCRFRVGLGASCTVDRACLSGLSCDPVARTCIAPSAACP
jgi:hypothetical protein